MCPVSISFSLPLANPISSKPIFTGEHEVSTRNQCANDICQPKWWT
uniref:PP1/PP2A phosphatases pleiotropic regulator PRL1 n=1 Tax=Rhizophora mucronata TaxID=61149 RepID=A0A2P2JHF9_RHIMU